MFIRVAAASLSLALCSAGLLAAQPAAPAPAASSLADIAAKRASAMVTIKFMLKSEQGDREVEAPGVMIEADGLVLASNFPFGGLSARFGGPTMSPTDIKVLIGEDTQGVEAALQARDSDLGLAWVKIKEPKSPYSFVDFSDAATPAVGDTLYVVSLLGKFFDRAPAVSQGTVTAAPTKPRKLFIPSLSLADTDFGMPVFDAAGKPAGIVSLILPDKDEAPSPDKLGELLGGVQRMIVPAADVAAATKHAKEQTPEAPAPAPEPAPAAAPATPK